MQLLILSCNTGEGHNSAAKALKDCFLLHKGSCDIKDALSYWSPEKSKLISKGHVFIYRRLPKLFGVSYRFEENHRPKDGDESLMYDLVTKGCEALYAELRQSSYDAVICTHVFSAMMMTELRRRHNFRLPTYFVATDYTCSPGVGESDLDGYFIPHPALTEEFVKNGVCAQRLIPTGIPVRQAFYEHLTPVEAKRRLHLPEDRRVVLLMCGSMGCGPIRALTGELPELLPDDIQLVVICGNNRRLSRSLTKFELPENLTVIGYTMRMSLYMDAACLSLTKPGGLSSTEACVKHLPMIFIDAVPGCETRNKDFFLLHGLADARKDATELTELVCDYLEHPEKLRDISDALEKSFSGCAAEKIYEYVNKDITHENR